VVRSNQDNGANYASHRHGYARLVANEQNTKIDEVGNSFFK
jgi:hypothetical protein